MKFTELEEAIVALGAPVVSARVSQPSDGLSRNTKISIKFVRGTTAVSEEMFKQIISIINERRTVWNRGVLIISFYDEDISSIDVTTMASRLGVSDRNIFFTGSNRLTFYQYAELESLVALWG